MHIDKTGQCGEWCYEIVKVKLRKTSEFGLPYTGICDFNIVNGELNIEGLLCTDFSRKDAEDLKNVANMFGFTNHKSRKPSDV